MKTLVEVVDNQKGIDEPALKRQVGFRIIKILKDAYEHLQNIYNPHAGQRIKTAEMETYVLLGAIAFLRNSDHRTLGYVRSLYNINQIWDQVERITYFRNEFYKMQKFKLIKLSGLATGLQFSNAIEFFLNRSLYNPQYVEEMMHSNGPADSKAIRLREIQAKWLYYYYGCEHNVGDTGVMGCNMEEYIWSFKRILSYEEFDFALSYYQVGEKYVGDPDGILASPQDASIQGEVYKKCKFTSSSIDYAKRILLSKETALLIYDTDGRKRDINEDMMARLREMKTYTKFNVEEQLKQREKMADTRKKNAAAKAAAEAGNQQQQEQQELDPEDEERKKREEKEYEGLTPEEREKAEKEKLKQELRWEWFCQTVADPRTGLSYNVSNSKSLTFELSLMSPNCELLLGIIHGETEVLLKKDNVIGLAASVDPEIPKMYRAILGIQSFNKSQKKDKRMFKEYLGAIFTAATSDLSKTEEILNFCMSKKLNLNEILNALEITDESMIDLLFMNVRASSSEEDDDDAGKENIQFDLEGVLRGVLDLKSEEVKIFYLLKDVYKQKLEGIKNAIAKLIKRSGDEPDQEYDSFSDNDDEENETRSKKDEAKKKKSDSSAIFKLLSYIDIQALNPNIKDKSLGNIFNLIKLPKEEEEENAPGDDPEKKQKKKKGESKVNAALVMFEKLILELDIFKNSKLYKEKDTILRIFNVVDGILRRDFSILFKEFIFDEAAEKFAPKEEEKKDGEKKDGEKKDDNKEIDKKEVKSAAPKVDLLSAIFTLFGIKHEVPALEKKKTKKIDPKEISEYEKTK